MTRRQATRRVDYYHDPNAPQPTSRKPSASVVVRGEAGAVLLLQRVDNGLWTIPTGGLEANESIKECAVRECREETGIEVQITGLVGVFSDPAHVIVYVRDEVVQEVRQPVNICLHGRPVGGALAPDPKEAVEVSWFRPDEIDGLDIHPAISTRIAYALGGSPVPHVD